MYLIDTNILIWILRGKENYLKWFEKISFKSTTSISVISVGEIYQNILTIEFEKTEELLDKFKIFHVTLPIAKKAGLYWQFHIKKYKELSLPDCLIAATAKQYNLKLVTLNTKHFPMDDIEVLKPF